MPKWAVTTSQCLISFPLMGAALPRWGRGRLEVHITWWAGPELNWTRGLHILEGTAVRDEVKWLPDASRPVRGDGAPTPGLFPLGQGRILPTCLPCVASCIARRQESWRLCVASCAQQLATHLFGPLFLADEWLDQGPAKSISWSDMARVKQEMPGQHRIGPSTPISTGWWLYISSQLLWLLGVFSL